jgi:hypothetical protein
MLGVEPVARLRSSAKPCPGYVAVGSVGSTLVARGLGDNPDCPP